MKKLLLALATGILLALGWPTYGFPFLLFFAFIPLLMVEYRIRHFSRGFKRTQLFFISFLTFFVWNLITTYWIMYADFAGAMVAITANSFFMSIVILAYHFVAKKTTQIRSLVFFVAMWMTFEKIHLEWQISWPWLTLGNAFSQYHECIQWYEFTGVFGGSLWLLIANVILFYSIITFKGEHIKALLPKLALQFGCIVFIPLIISLLLYYTYTESKETINVVVLQPNLDPYTEKFTTKNEKVITDLFQLAATTVSKDSTDFLITPETVLVDEDGLDIDKFIFSPEKFETKVFLNNYPRLNYLFGAEFYRIHRDERTISTTSNKYEDGLWLDSFNSAVLMSANSNFQVYHKSKLVPGIENFPYRKLLNPFLGNIMINMGGTVRMKTTQKERTTLTANNGKYKVAPVICYESIYGEFVTDYVKNGANFLAILTNDAWWNNTQGHKQHLSYAKLRAIETRKAIARSANTGVSAFINERGDVTSSQPYNTKAALASKVTLNSKQTFYVYAGDYLAKISIAVAGLFLLLAILKRKK